MKFEEYDQLLDQMLQSPEEALEKALDFKEALKEDLMSIEALTNKQGELEEKLKRSHEREMNLYLRLGGGQTSEEVKEEPKAIEEMTLEEFEEAMNAKYNTEV